MKTIKKTLLHYQKGTSNKVYNVYLLEVSRGKYLVNFEYGRFGTNLREGSKTLSPVGLEKAQKVFDSLVVSKMNKEYIIKEAYDSTKKKEKKEKKVLDANEYKALLLERLKRVGAVEIIEETTQRREGGATGFRAIHSALVSSTTRTEKFKKVDNYEVSRLIYRAGEVKLEGVKELIVALFEQGTQEENAFYYSVAWTLGRYRDVTLRPIFESLREKLDESSRYIVEEALFLLGEQEEKQHIKALTFSLPYSMSLRNNNIEAFTCQVEELSNIIKSIYSEYEDAEYYDTEKIRKKLMPYLSQADELYLKLYMWTLVDEKHREAFMAVLHLLPINKFNFSLFRRLYKMAEFREDYEVLGHLVTNIEAKKMGCYSSYDYNTYKSKASVGCSKEYFKKRSYRFLENVSKFDEEGYIDFAKGVLLSVNYEPDAFEPFEQGAYDHNWNWRTKKYDAFASHITFMYIVYGAGKRYAIEDKKLWTTVNPEIHNEHRPESHKELWDKYPEKVIEILAKSRVLEVQTFAFNILKENDEALNSISLEMLLEMMNLKYEEARDFFFNVLKERYQQSKDDRIIKAFLFSNNDEIIDFAIEEITHNLEFLLIGKMIIQIIEQCNEKTMVKILLLFKKLENKRSIVEDIFYKIAHESLPLNAMEEDRMFRFLTDASTDIKVEDIINLMSEDTLTQRHLFAAKLIRLETLLHLEYPLELKEKIANYNHPEMLATTIYLLGQLEPSELMEAHEMLIAFLYHEEKSVHKEARKIIETLAKNKEDGAVLLRAIVEKSFAAASDDVKANVVATVKKMKASYGAIEPDQLYRMLIAKSKLAVTLGGLILSNYKATDFSVVQWARMAKNENKTVRVWAYDAYMDNVELVKEAMPKSLMIFDSAWEDTRVFASGYFESFEMNTDEIIVIADSNYADVQAFAKKMIGKGDYDMEVMLTKLSQHPALSIQKFVTDLMLAEMSDEQLLKMERFFNTLLHSVNQNRVAKTRTMMLLKKRLENQEIAKMIGRLATHHSATMVWADKEVYVEMMAFIAEHYAQIELPLSMVEVEKREVV